MAEFVSLPPSALNAYAGYAAAPGPQAAVSANAAPLPVDASYQGMLDQLSLSSPYYAPQPATLAPAPVTATFQIPVLSGLFQELKDLVSHLFAPAPAPNVPTTPPTTPSPQHAAKPTSFVMSSFNVLGNSHTQAGGEKPWLASGPERMKSVVKLLDAKNVDIVGFQEFQHPQYQEFMKLAGDRYGVYPGTSKGNRDTENSIAWRKDKWDLVKPSTVAIPYFDGHIRQMPVVLLRNKQTGQEAYFINVHNPADTHRFHNQGQYRDRDKQIEIALINRLRQTGLPVFLTGDMNETASFYHEVAPATHMQSASAPNGKLPKTTGIDWIYGSPDVSFSGYVRDTSTIKSGTSDHPMVTSRVRIPGSAN